MSLGHSYGAFGKTGSNGLGSEAGTTLSPFRFKISKTPDRFAGHIDTDVLRGSVGVADKGSYTLVLKMRSRSRRAVSAVSASSLPGAWISASASWACFKRSAASYASSSKMA